MIYVNELYRVPRATRDDLEALTLLLAPFAPHLAEEAWQRLGHGESLTYQPWPEFVEAFTIEDVITVAAQVNGKLRGDLQVPVDSTEEAILEQARRHENVSKHLEGKQLVKQIYVKGKLVNFVVK